VDIDPNALRLAGKLGAAAVINARDADDVVERIHSMTGQGAHLSIDALGSATTCVNSILCLRKRGRHIQIGLLAGDDFQPRIPMEHVIAKELELVGSHGMPAHRYDAMLDMIMSGTIDPRQLIGKAVSLEDAPAELEGMGQYGGAGITVIDRF
jgi:alcohol dehydrogenase